MLHVNIAVVNKQLEKQPNESILQIFYIVVWSRGISKTSATSVKSYIMKHLDWLC